ncbi:hypothetical protein D4764_20G0001050 [Takifugu flavidus]|uniref:Uncharacterized protein n=1 Tax=Takifugu flavidus TaxID=433684 RepID=A0A5C6NFX0_9TELE|nr:hypothetical protein D4764_20G0001050 [Takifugu flavidus]
MPVRAVTTRFMYKGLCTIPDVLSLRSPVILPEDEVEGVAPKRLKPPPEHHNSSISAASACTVTPLPQYDTCDTPQHLLCGKKHCNYCSSNQPSREGDGKGPSTFDLQKTSAILKMDSGDHSAH